MNRGVITTRDLLMHGVLIVRGFGLRTWLRCWRALVLRQSTTFLELVFTRP